MLRPQLGAGPGAQTGPRLLWLIHIGRPCLKSHLTLWGSALLQMKSTLEGALGLSFLYVNYSYHENNFPDVYVSSKSYYN